MVSRGRLRLSFCLPVSLCWYVHKACKHDTDITVSVRTVTHGTQTSYGKKTTPIVLRSGVKGQGHTLNINVKPCEQDKDRIVWVRTVKLGVAVGDVVNFV